ncbi:MAG: PIN domain-containing protein [Nocardioides sp.]|uniref:type II toxin-antitoxin system VapC family toxin n=1 Tax=Nocardioides sp. TaxID=35761 RepID=UPI0039E6573C
MNAFDSDVLIYAASPSGAVTVPGVRALFEGLQDGEVAGMGSVLLAPEVLIKPQRCSAHDDAAAAEARTLAELLSRIDLWPVDDDVMVMAVGLGARYGLKTVDACHLATAVLAGADRFVTNNRKDFTRDIEEIDVVYPDEM